MDVSCEIISGVVNELVQQNGGKPPTPAQLAEAMGLEVPEAKEILKELRNDGLLPPAAKTSKVMKRPAAAVIPAAEASPPAEASMPATPGNDLYGPKASENSDTAQGATVRKVPNPEAHFYLKTLLFPRINLKTPYQHDSQWEHAKSPK